MVTPAAPRVSLATHDPGVLQEIRAASVSESCMNATPAQSGHTRWESSTDAQQGPTSEHDQEVLARRHHGVGLAQDRRRHAVGDRPRQVPF